MINMLEYIMKWLQNNWNIRRYFLESIKSIRLIKSYNLKIEKIMKISKEIKLYSMINIKYRMKMFILICLIY